LGMSFFQGTIQLTDLHLRQDMTNRLIDSMGIPISLKTGLIKRVSIAFSVLSFWSNPLELTIEDLYLVVGPSTFFQSNEESYIDEPAEDILNASYDSTNAFNVFDHEMKIKSGGGDMGGPGAVADASGDSQVKALDNLKYLSQTDFLKEKLIDEEKQVQNVRLIFKNIKLRIDRLHIRYEDDFYQSDLGKKFAFGIIIRSLQLNSGNDDWQFPQQKKYGTDQSQKGPSEFPDQSGTNYKRVQVDTRNMYREVTPETANLLIKEIGVQ